MFDNQENQGVNYPQNMDKMRTNKHPKRVNFRTFVACKNEYGKSRKV